MTYTQDEDAFDPRVLKPTNAETAPPKASPILDTQTTNASHLSNLASSDTRSKNSKVDEESFDSPPRLCTPNKNSKVDDESFDDPPRLDPPKSSPLCVPSPKVIGTRTPELAKTQPRSSDDFDPPALQPIESPQPGLSSAVRCPTCGSTNVAQNQYIPNGKKCGDCRHRFVLPKRTFPELDWDEIKSIADDIFGEGLSLHTAAKRSNVQNVYAMTLSRIVNEIAVESFTPLEYAKVKNLRFSPYLGVDCFFIPIRSLRRKLLVLICSDCETGYILIASIIEPKSDENNSDQRQKLYECCLAQLKIIDYRPELIITDGERALINALRHQFPGVPIQNCLKHFQDNTAKKLPTDKPSNEIPLERRRHWEEVKEDINGIIFANSRKEADRRLESLLQREKNCADKEIRDVLRSLTDRYEALIAYLNFPDAPRTNNDVEQQNLSIKRKFLLRISFNTDSSANNNLKLLANCKNLTPYASSEAGREGVSPAQLCGDTSQGHWLDRICKRRIEKRRSKRKRIDR